MNQYQSHKCVIVLQSGLPAGLSANAAAVLGISLRKIRPEIVAEDLGSGFAHAVLSECTRSFATSRGGGIKAHSRLSD